MSCCSISNRKASNPPPPTCRTGPFKHQPPHLHRAGVEQKGTFNARILIWPKQANKLRHNPSPHILANQNRRNRYRCDFFFKKKSFLAMHILRMKYMCLSPPLPVLEDVIGTFADWFILTLLLQCWGEISLPHPD